MTEAIDHAIEGCLDIRCVNCDAAQATPQYDLIFLRYTHFMSGAQQPNRIVGTAALEAYLVKLGFTPDAAGNWIGKIHENNVVSIPNMMMPAQHLADYGL